MNRAELSWAMTACLPHAKDWLGIDRTTATVWATDTYTSGVARMTPTVEDSETFAPTFLSIGEAKDLARFVKVTRKAHEVENVQLLVNGDELHVGVDGDSAVFETHQGGLDLSVVFQLLEGLYALPDDKRELVFQPAFAARFAKAQRYETDALRVYPRLTHRPVERGVALVTVGTDFIGAIAGLTHDDAPGVLASFLQTAQIEEVA